MAENTPVLFVHGLWMTGAEGVVLGHRLSAYGFALNAFRYGTTSTTLGDVMAPLATAIRDCGPNARLIGHSLGGLMILRCLADHPDLSVGPVVLLGSPVNGSEAARGVARIPGAGWLLGEAAAGELLTPNARTWSRSSPLGVIAGDWPVGMGTVVAELPLPHDGAVSVAETRLAGATDHRIFPVNHMGLLLSAAVARAAAGFLNVGRFPD